MKRFDGKVVWYNKERDLGNIWNEEGTFLFKLSKVVDGKMLEKGDLVTFEFTDKGNSKFNIDKIIKNNNND